MEFRSLGLSVWKQTATLLRPNPCQLLAVTDYRPKLRPKLQTLSTDLEPPGSTPNTTQPGPCNQNEEASSDILGEASTAAAGSKRVSVSLKISWIPVGIMSTRFLQA